jgi:hypothetical protein
MPRSTRAAIVAALEWTFDGLDFADALQLASAKPANIFATFDASPRRPNSQPPPHDSLVAMRAPSASAASFAQTTLG